MIDAKSDLAQRNNPRRTEQILLPKVVIFHFGRGLVDCAWNYTRKVPFWFLYYNTDPGACLEFDGNIIRPDGSEIILIPPNTAFRTSCETSFRHLYIHFTAGPPFSQVKPGVLLFDRSICGTLDMLLNSKTASHAAVYALLFSVLAAIPEEQFEIETDQTDDRIRHALMLMSQGVKKAEICKKIGMSPSNFQRRFKEETGMTPHKYFMKLSMEKARAMLSLGTVGINEIAQVCGFADRYIFSKAFRKDTGVPPAEYRFCNKKSAGNH